MLNEAAHSLRVSCSYGMFSARRAGRMSRYSVYGSGKREARRRHSPVDVEQDSAGMLSA